MLSAFLIINSLCSNHCKYCFYNTGHLKRTSSVFDFSKIKKLITFLKEYGINEICLTGGDCLHKSIFNKTLSFVKKMKSSMKNLKVNIISSAVNINEKNIYRLKEAKVDVFFISIDSVNVKTNDFLRGNTIKTLKAIKLLIENNVEVRTISVITAKNIHEVRRTYDTLKKMGVKEIIFQPVFLPLTYSDPFNLRIDNLDRIQIKKLFLCLRNILLEQNKERYYYLLEKLYLKQETINSINCFMGNKKIVIHQNGNVTRCFHDQNVLGNIFDKNLRLPLKFGFCNNFGKKCVSLFAEKYYCGVRNERN